MEEYYVPKRPLISEPVLWWILLIFLVLAGGVMAIVAVDAYRIAKLNKEFVLTGFPVQQDGVSAKKRTQPIAYDNAYWRVAFDVAPEYSVTERVVSEDGEVELTLQHFTSEDLYSDTTVRVWIGKDSGFNRYLIRPFSTYGGYRRITAVARRAITYADPAHEDEARQVVVVDDSRNGREVRVTYSALQDGAEALALNILQTMRLAAREKGADILHKDGWRIFTYTPIRFQYPEDYRADRQADGKIMVSGAGGRIEIEPITDVFGAQAAATRFAGKSTADERLPDEFFDLKYNVTLRIKMFYTAGDEYQKTILQDISRTISIRE